MKKQEKEQYEKKKPKKLNKAGEWFFGPQMDHSIIHDMRAVLK